MNTECRGIALLDIDTVYPFGIEMGFKDEDVVIDYLSDSIKESITDVVEYWCKSTAITDGDSYKIQWTSPNTLTVNAAFWKGSFDGDLMHRKAITTGDGRFTIGLVKLFYEGYKPKTRHGNGVSRSRAIPLYIKCLHQDPCLSTDMLERFRNVTRKKLNSIISDLVETVRSM